jgi:hypothetical protein
MDKVDLHTIAGEGRLAELPVTTLTAENVTIRNASDQTVASGTPSRPPYFDPKIALSHRILPTS